MKKKVLKETMIKKRNKYKKKCLKKREFWRTERTTTGTPQRRLGRCLICSLAGSRRAVWR
jgi:hypothetical protein